MVARCCQQEAGYMHSAAQGVAQLSQKQEPMALYSSTAAWVAALTQLFWQVASAQAPRQVSIVLHEVSFSQAAVWVAQTPPATEETQLSQVVVVPVVEPVAELVLLVVEPVPLVVEPVLLVVEPVALLVEPVLLVVVATQLHQVVRPAEAVLQSPQLAQTKVWPSLVR
jgi:hypothetical protein